MKNFVRNTQFFVQKSVNFIVFDSLIVHPVFVGVAFAFAGVWFYIYNLRDIVGTIQLDIKYIESFIEWFGVPYGFFIGLVLVNLWAKHDAVEREFDIEADATSTIYQTILLVKKNPRPAFPKNTIIIKVEAYISHVQKHYKNEHEKNGYEAKKQGDNYLKDIRDAIGVLLHTTEEESIKLELLNNINQLADARADRITHSRQKTPKVVWVVAIVSSVLWLIPFYGLHFNLGIVTTFLVGGVTFIVAAILAIVWDLDHPFTGTWKIGLDAWDELERRVTTQSDHLRGQNPHSAPKK